MRDLDGHQDCSSDDEKQTYYAGGEKSYVSLSWWSTLQLGVVEWQCKDRVKQLRAERAQLGV